MIEKLNGVTIEGIRIGLKKKYYFIYGSLFY